MTAGFFGVPNDVADRLLSMPDGIWCLGAYCCLRKHAAWKSRVEIVGGKRITVERGQLPISVRKLADKLACSVGKAQRFLRAIRERDMIRVEIDSGLMVITVCNYAMNGEADNAADSHVSTASDSPASTQDEERKNKYISPLTPQGGDFKKSERRSRRELRDDQKPPAMGPLGLNILEWRRFIDGWCRDGFWLGEWGPEPGEPDCYGPPDLVAAARARGKGTPVPRPAWTRQPHLPLPIAGGRAA